MFSTILLVVMAVLGGLVTILAAVAPLTKSEMDNKLLTALRWLRDLVGQMIGHPSVASLK